MIMTNTVENNNSFFIENSIFRRRLCPSGSQRPGVDFISLKTSTNIIRLFVEF